MHPRSTHFLSISDVEPHSLEGILRKATEIKKNPLGFSAALSRKGLAYYSEKPSTRTRLSFQAAVQQMGGFYMELSNGHSQNGKEDACDTAKVVSKYADFLAARVYEHELLEEFARHSGIPVINGLSDSEHPCQALADLQTIRELKPGKRVIAFVGDGNNVCASLAIGACMLGYNVKVASPPGFELPDDIIAKCCYYDGSIELFSGAREAVEGADVVYTDVWVSMGDESEAQKRLQAFQGFQVNDELIGLAKKDAVFMHCLPAVKGQEVTKEVIDGPQSVVFQQAENRLHSQKALLLHLNES